MKKTFANQNAIKKVYIFDSLNIYVQKFCNI